MNRMLFGCVISVICVPLAIAQPAAVRVTAKAPQNASSAKAPGTTRVAVINLGYILTKYERSSVLKAELQAELKSMQDEAKKLSESVNMWQSALQKNEFKNGTKEDYEEKLITARRRLEDLTRLAQTKVGKAQQAHLLTLWNDVHEAVKAYSAQHGIGLVMAYGDPLQKDAGAFFQTVTRKLQTADAGGAMPFFMAPGVDISEEVTDFLNKRYREDNDNSGEK